MTTYRPGDIVEYQTFTGSTRYVEITSWEPDVKNGREGFDGIVTSGDEQGMSVWGYADQIVRLYARRAS